jgi:DNA-binding NarL/FixJ family response regulator
MAYSERSVPQLAPRSLNTICSPAGRGGDSESLFVILAVVATLPSRTKAACSTTHASSPGSSETEAIKALTPDATVVMLIDRTDQQALMRAIGAGSTGFVAKTDAIDKLIAAIHSARNGAVDAPITELPRLLAQLRSTNRGPGSDLGPRELEVLRLMAACPTKRWPHSCTSA